MLWDMDGTLLESEKIWGEAFHGLAAHLGGALTPEQRESMLGEHLAIVIARLFEALGREPTDEDRRRADAWLEDHARERLSRPIPWRPGACDALTRVRASGAATALVTNTKRVLTECSLETLGRGNFDVTVCGDEVAHGKPSPEAYLRAAELLGLDPSHCLAVEDSPAGAAAAEAAGCWVVVVPSGAPVSPGGRRRTFRRSLVGFDHSTELFRTPAGVVP